MTVSDSDWKLDEMECENLQRAISEVETARAAAPPGARSFFENFLLNAKGRIAALEKKIKETKAEKETEAREHLALAYLAQNEAALSASEKQTFSGFLGKPFFTKDDFGSLEKFYSHTWDRLSEAGKDEMSRRVWEGIRRNEYTFAELPKVVRDKETEHAYKRLRDSAIGSVEAQRIPEKDREDFIRAYESGKREEAEQILGRDSFANGMFRGSESRSVDHARVDSGRDSDGKSVGGQVAAGDLPDKVPQEPVKSAGKANLDVSDLNLDGLQLAEASSAPSSANIPRDGAVRLKNGTSLGNG